MRKWIRLFGPAGASEGEPRAFDESDDETSDADSSDSSFNKKRDDADRYVPYGDELSAEQSAAEALMCLPGLLH